MNAIRRRLAAFTVGAAGAFFFLAPAAITDDELCVLLTNTAPAEAVQVAGSLAGVLEIAGVRSTVRAGAMEVQKT